MTKEERREYRRKWSAANPEKIKAYEKRRRARNPDYQRKWKAANPDKFKKYIARYNRSAKGKAARKRYLATPRGKETIRLGNSRREVKSNGEI